MTDKWDFYFCQVENKPASIYVDLGLIDHAPIDNLNYMAYVSVKMNSPREDGLSSQDEYDSLINIEDTLTQALVSNETVYVGCSTSDNNRDFFFYVADPNDWRKRVSESMALFYKYKYFSDTQEDKGWSTFLTYLYPDDRTLQSISSRRVCESLEADGDKLILPREIDHWVYFDDLRSRNTFVEDAKKLDYKVRIVRSPDKDFSQFLAQLWRNDVPSYRNIDNATLPLYDLAIKHQGDYDGWECEVLAED
jgi:uncharacterized protein (TIGR01619 family)